MATEFSQRVIAAIRKIPHGKVATYGQLANLAGKPQGARGVSWILYSSSRAQNLPWWRVINGKGQISFPLYSKAYLRQRALLEREGVEFVDGGLVDMKMHQWSRLARKSVKKRPVRKSAPKKRGGKGN